MFLLNKIVRKKKDKSSHRHEKDMKNTNERYLNIHKIHSLFAKIKDFELGVLK